MGYLKIFKDATEYNNDIGNNGYAQMPAVSIYENDGKTVTKYLKRPKYQALYNKTGGQLFRNNINVKKVWLNGELLFEHPSQIKQQEVVVTANDFTLLSNNQFENVNQDIILRSALYDALEININGDILETDELIIALPIDGKLYALGGQIKQLSFGQDGGLKNGKLYLTEAQMGNYDNATFFYIQRNNTVLDTIIRFKGPDWWCNTTLKTDGDNIPYLPNKAVYRYMIFESNIELDDYADGLYLASNGEYEVLPLYYLKEMGFPIIDNKVLYFPIGGQMLDGTNLQMSWCHINYNENGEVENISFPMQTTITINYMLDICTLTQTSNEDFLIEYEPFNRFTGVNFEGTNVIVFDDILRYNTQIYPYQFRNCPYLREVEIPNNITTIGLQAFENCTNLSKVIISENTTYIRSDCFKDCSSLTEIVCYADIQDSIIIRGNIAQNGTLKIPRKCDVTKWNDLINNKNWNVEYI